MGWKPESCLECFKILESYCELYHMFKCRELELNIQLEKLNSIIRVADEDPKRLHGFKDWCLLGRKNMDKAMEFRREFKEQCEKSISRNYPKVKLIRILNKSANTTDKSIETVRDDGESRESELRAISAATAPVPSPTLLTSKLSCPVEQQENEDNFISSPVPSPLLLSDSPPSSPIQTFRISTQHNSRDEPTESNKVLCSQPGTDERRNHIKCKRSYEELIEIDLVDARETVMSTLPINQISIERIDTEPPCRKLKASYGKPIAMDLDVSEKGITTFPKNQINKETNGPAVPRRKGRDLLTCTLCTATFSTSSTRDEHVSKCSSSNSHNSNQEIIGLDSSDVEDDDPGDADWAAAISNNEENGSDEDQNTEGDGRQITDSSGKKSVPRKAKRTRALFKTSSVAKSASARCVKKTPSSKFNIKCNKCSSNPEFFSIQALQIHQNYFHTNGYVNITKDDAYIIHLRLQHLKLRGILTRPVSWKCCWNFFPKCPEKFLTTEELKKHKKYHGDFSCKTCHTKMDNAVDMARHQLEHFKDSDIDDGSGIVSCGQCGYVTVFENELIDHYLVKHMDKLAIQATCPICKEKFKHVEKVPVLHYMNCHDVARLENSATLVLCDVAKCPAYFLTEDQLQQHKNTSHVTGSGKSDVTPDISSGSNELTYKHRKIANKRISSAKKLSDGETTCKLCPEKFKTIYTLKKHVLYCHGDKEREKPCQNILLTDDGMTIDDFVTDTKCICKVSGCGKVFGNLDQLERHRTHHGEFKCNFCDVVKTMATELALHETIHNDWSTGPGFKCPRCPLISKVRTNYVEHHLVVHLKLDNDRKRCPICRKPPPPKVAFSTTIGLRKWITTHYLEYHDKNGINSETMHKCTKCTGYFRTAAQYNKHNKEIHGLEQTHDCSTCGQTYKTAEKLKRHRVNSHKLDESTFEFGCSFPECDRRFERKLDLFNHEARAHNQKDATILMCSDCGKKFSRPVALSQHRTIHVKTDINGVKNQTETPNNDLYVCEHCGRRFSTRSSLKAHNVWHIDKSKWEFECSTCSKKCATPGKLKEHMRVHSKEKALVCQECGSTYAHRHNWRGHMKKAHGIIV